MKAPVCMVCHQFIKEEGGGNVYFADYTPLPEGMMGHPHGWEFFCKDHLAAAQALSHLPWEEAFAELQRQYGVFPKPWEDPDYGKPPKFQWNLKSIWDFILMR